MCGTGSLSTRGGGTRSGLLTVYGNVCGWPGDGGAERPGHAPATIVLTPAALTFPATSVGLKSLAGNITVANTGGNPSALQMPVVSGDFQISANSCGASLAPQNSCTVSIVFAPSASGSRTGTLTVVDDAGTQVASLMGMGTMPAMDALAPVSLMFAAQQIGSASAMQSVTLTNAGDVALTLIAASITTGDFSVVNACGSSLNAHSTCTFQVAYVPKALGAAVGVLSVSDQFRTQGGCACGHGAGAARRVAFPCRGATVCGHCGGCGVAWAGNYVDQQWRGAAGDCGRCGDG